MVDQQQLSSLASYLGKYADRVLFDSAPVVRSDEYSTASYFKVRVPTQDGYTNQSVKLGPTELYGYPDGDQSKPAEFKGILNESGQFIPCQKDENGDFLVPTVDGQVQVILSAENLAKRDKLSRTVYKLNYLNREPVFQSEERIPHPEGRAYQEPEAYTVTHTNGDQIVGPIEYYAYPKDGKGKPEFIGILGADGFVIPCSRNADGDFEVMDQNQQKQIIPSAENESKPYKTFRTEYFKGQPIFQRMTGERKMIEHVAQPKLTNEELLRASLDKKMTDTPKQQIGDLFTDPRAKDKLKHGND